MSVAPHKQVIYFPYINFRLPSAITFDGLTIWNFDTEIDQRIPDPSLREYVSKLIRSNVHSGRPIKNIAIISEKNSSFEPLKPSQIKTANDIRRILFLCGIAETNMRQGDNVGHFMQTAENFTLIFQNFQPGSRWTAFSSGGIVKITSGGNEIETTKYEKPPYVLTPSFGIDQELYYAIRSIKRRCPNIYKKILRATDAFMSGYFNSPDVGMTSRILMQTRAFEILFDLPDGEGRKIFKELIDKNSQEDGKKERMVRFLSERRGKNVPDKGSKQYMWADRFYTLRNHIIHGSAYRDKELNFGTQLHQDLAVYFFIVAVKKAINEALGKEIFFDTVTWKNKRFEFEPNSILRTLYVHLYKKLGAPKTFFEFQRPHEMLSRVKSIPKYDFVTSNKYKPHREAWMTGCFGVGYEKLLGKKCSISLGIIEPADALIRRGNGKPQVIQCTEVLEYGRKRHKEYREDIASTKPVLRPYHIPSDDETLEWLGGALKKKVAKNYPQVEKLNLIIYVNFDCHALTLKKARKLIKTSGANVFKSVWIFHSRAPEGREGLGEQLYALARLHPIRPSRFIKYNLNQPFK